MLVPFRSLFFRTLIGLAFVLLVGPTVIAQSGCASPRTRANEPGPVVAAPSGAAGSAPQPAPAQAETRVPTPGATSSTGSDDEQAPTTVDSDAPASAENGMSKRIPDVVPGPVLVRGSLDKLVIRRTLRGHLDELRACYLPALKKKPELSGRVTVQFTISPAGKVIKSELQKSRLKDDRVEKCVVKAFRGWEFPKPPGGDSVVVTHDFGFQAGWSGERHIGE